MRKEEVIHLLNKLNYENVELNIQNDFLKVENQHMRDLVNENRQLKAENDELVNETAKIIAEHQSKILNLIDDKVNELEKKYKFGQEVYHGCPMHNIRFGINTLKELKKELTE